MVCEKQLSKVSTIAYFDEVVGHTVLEIEEETNIIAKNEALVYSRPVNL